MNLPLDNVIEVRSWSAPELSDLIILHFTEVRYFLPTIDLHVKDDLVLTVAPEYENWSQAQATAQSDNSLIIQLRANDSSALHPVISAIEVYTRQWDGKPILPSSTKRNNLALMTGLSVGLPVGLLLAGGHLYVFSVTRKTGAGPWMSHIYQCKSASKW